MTIVDIMMALAVTMIVVGVTLSLVDPVRRAVRVQAATAEVQLGKMFSPSFGVYVDGLFGIGPARPYDWGVGVGVRFNY